MTNLNCDPHIVVMINDAKFRVCISSSFSRIELKNDGQTKLLVGLPIILKLKIKTLF